MFRYFQMNWATAVLLLLVTCFCGFGCGSPSSTPSRPKIGYVLMVRDATLEEARRGFFDALKDSGYEVGKTLDVIDQNAEGDISNLNQILDYCLSQKVSLIATNPTVVTIAAVSKTQTVPVCMMVSPRPDLVGLSKSPDEAPKNLFGVYETLGYIDTSVTLIKEIFPKAKRIGTIFNTSEPNSVNALRQLRTVCQRLGYELIEAGITNSNESQQAAQTLLLKKLMSSLLFLTTSFFPVLRPSNKLWMQSRCQLLLRKLVWCSVGHFWHMAQIFMNGADKLDALLSGSCAERRISSPKKYRFASVSVMPKP